ncbi:MAG: hypothetical protein MUO58_11460 [Anaerolineales bacterium]|nr:hypothetical protein [Anaerolineales bacterium]
MKRIFALLSPIMLLLLLTLACSISFDLGSSMDSGIFHVEAGEGWTNTHIKVEAGDLLTITYLSGRWSPWPGEEFDAIGFGGDPRCRCNVIMGVSHAALIGRIGDQDPFLVGERYQHSVGESGILYLGINDVDVYDNSGHLIVKVVVAEQ